MCGKQRTCATLLAVGPVPGRKRRAQMRKDSLYRILYALYQVGIPAVPICKLTRGRGQTSHFIPLASRVPALEE